MIRRALPLLLGCAALLLAAPATADPAMLQPSLSLAHPEVRLQAPMPLDDWRLVVQIPQGWTIEETPDEILISPPDMPNTGIVITETYEFTAATFQDGVVRSFTPDTGIVAEAEALSQVGMLQVPLVRALVPLDENQRVRQLLALFEFDPKEFPILVIASAPAESWAMAEPSLEAIVHSIAPLMTEEEAFAAAER
ncbi:MAG: hypothetical protein ABI743_00720, partial [bacterium]